MPAKEIMKKFKSGTLHSGSPKGPIVTNPHQAKAIQLSYARKEGADIPDSSGANYVSRNELHVQTQSAKGRTVPYRGVKGLSGESQETTVIKATSQSEPTGFGPSSTGDGIDCVQEVARVMNPVERARQKNNRTRDMRSNLGRGKGQLVVRGWNEAGLPLPGPRRVDHTWCLVARRPIPISE